MLPTLRPMAACLLALTLLGVARPASSPPAPHRLISPASQAPPAGPSHGVGTVARPAGPPVGWRRFTYGGAVAPGGGMPGYGIAYPPRWAARLWPDTLATYGRLDLRSPAGSIVDLALLPLRPGGPTLADLIAHDLSSLLGAARDSVALPLGTAVRLSGVPTPAGAGRVAQFLYLRRGAVVYRLFLSRPAGPIERDALTLIASTLRSPAPAGGPPPTTMPPSAPPPPGAGCCHCPAWGAGWGIVLTSLDGVPVYSNAEDANNGCDGKYGILYQCVELAQRYFALRWGYPDVWGGVGAAADMRVSHPAGITFIPNGGSPGPREGDAVIFYGGGYGHVAVVSGVDRQAGRLDLVEENWSPSGGASLPLYADNTVGIRDSAYGSYTVAGWLHSAKNM